MKHSPFTQSSLLMLGAVGLSLSLAGCNCGKQIAPGQGQLSIVYDEGGVTKTSTEGGTYDFGTVPMGKTTHLKLQIKNTGTTSLFLNSLTKTSGDATAINGGDAVANPIFNFTDFAGGNTEVASGDVRSFDITFNSLQDDANKMVSHSAALTLSANIGGKDSTVVTATIDLKGLSVSGECELPDTLDFGAVALGDSYSLSVTINNTRPIDSQAFIGDVTSSSGDDKAFTFSPDSPKGDFTIPSMKSRTVSLSFSPTTVKSYVALDTMRAADGCPDVVVKLVGEGVNNVLDWQPRTLDFGYITPGLNQAGKFTFQNLGLKPVVVSNFTTNPNPSDFKSTDMMITVPAATRDASNNLVPGTIDYNVNFKPSLLGPRTAALKFDIDLPKQPNGTETLKGYGGGPDIDVKPSPLAFGRVAYFANANPLSYTSRKLTIENVGTRPTPPDPKANLHLLPNGAGGAYWDVSVVSGAADASELCLGDYDNGSGTCTNGLALTEYDPSVGIEASGTKALLDVPIRFTPTAVGGNNGDGNREWKITIYSDDPDEPTFEVHVTAQALVLPPCDYTVSPLNVNFGLLTPPSFKDLGITITNNGQTPDKVCLISSVDMAPGSDPAFSLPAGAVYDTELQPGTSMNIDVRAWPQGAVPTTIQNITGQVVISASSPTKPTTTVALSASVAQSCLSIVPTDLNFGTVQKDCSSATRTFTIYNTCLTAVTINSFSMVSPAGEPAGGPECPGSTACPEFIPVSVSGIAPLTVINSGASPVTFSLKYHPINYGPDNGAFLLNVKQNTQNVDYIVTLEGNGDTMGLNTDTFKQDTKPKADILLVIDNSGSMSDKQAALAANFASFIQYAVSANVDYQIGVTTTDFDDPAQSGRLQAQGGNPKIITPNTPNLTSAFQANVNVGDVGSGLEHHFDPGLAALTAPLITTDNAGLLRADAVLAVVSVSDADDQSPNVVSYYVNNLLNIKGVQHSNQFSWNAIAPLSFTGPPVANCSYDDLAWAGAARDRAMVQQTNGVQEEICNPDWAKALEQIGKNAFGYRTNFYLTATPDQTNGKVISVSIDGQSLPSVDSRGANVWTYDPAGNAIDFEPLFVPEPGQTLTITYYVACIP